MPCFSSLVRGILLLRSDDTRAPARREGRRAAAEAGSVGRVAESAMDSTFSRDCEAWPTASSVPALAVGTSRRRRRGARRGRLPRRRASSGSRRSRSRSPRRSPRARCSLGASRPASGPDVRVRHLLAHLSGYDCERGDLARFGDGDDALARLARRASLGARRLPAGRRLVVLRTRATGSRAGSSRRPRGATYEELVERARGRLGLAARPRSASRLAGTGSARSARAYPRARRPSGGLVSNVADLLRFGRWQLAEPGAAGAAAAARAPDGAASTGSASPASTSAASTSGGTAARTAASSRRSCSCPTATRSSSG